MHRSRNWETEAVKAIGPASGVDEGNEVCHSKSRVQGGAPAVRHVVGYCRRELETKKRGSYKNEWLKTVGLVFSEVQAGCAGAHQGALKLAFRL